MKLERIGGGGGAAAGPTTRSRPSSASWTRSASPCSSRSRSPRAAAPAARCRRAGRRRGGARVTRPRRRAAPTRRLRRRWHRPTGARASRVAGQTEKARRSPSTSQTSSNGRRTAPPARRAPSPAAPRRRAGRRAARRRRGAARGARGGRAAPRAGGWSVRVAAARRARRRVPPADAEGPHAEGAALGAAEPPQRARGGAVDGTVQLCAPSCDRRYSSRQRSDGWQRASASPRLVARLLHAVCEAARRSTIGGAGRCVFLPGRRARRGPRRASPRRGARPEDTTTAAAEAVHKRVGLGDRVADGVPRPTARGGTRGRHLQPPAPRRRRSRRATSAAAARCCRLRPPSPPPPGALRRLRRRLRGPRGRDGGRAQSRCPRR